MRALILIIMFILISAHSAAAIESKIENIQFLDNIIQESRLENVLPTEYGDLSYKSYEFKLPTIIGLGTFIDSRDERQISYITIGTKNLIFDTAYVIEDPGKDIEVNFRALIAAGESFTLESDLKNQVWKIDGNKVDKLPIVINRTSEVRLTGEFKEKTENKLISILIVNGKFIKETIVSSSSSKYREAKSNTLKAYTLYNKLPENEKSQFSEEYNRMITDFNTDDFDNAIHDSGQLIQLITFGNPDLKIKELQDTNETLKFYLIICIIALAVVMVFSLSYWYKMRNHPFMLLFELYSKKLIFDEKRLNIPDKISYYLRSDQLCKIASHEVNNNKRAKQQYRHWFKKFILELDSLLKGKRAEKP